MLGAPEHVVNEVPLPGAAEDSDDDDEIILKKTRKTIKPAIFDSDEEDEGCPPDSLKENLDPQVQKTDQEEGTEPKEDAGSESDQEDKSESDKTDGDIEMKENASSVTKLSRILQPDLIDSEGESEDEGNIEAKSQPQESDQSESCDEEDDQPNKPLNPKYNLKGGASKVSAGARKQSKNNLDVHSETQRIVRESAVRIPYHKPKPLSLQALLNKTQQKQQQLQAVKGPLWKLPPSKLPQIPMTTCLPDDEEEKVEKPEAENQNTEEQITGTLLTDTNNDKKERNDVDEEELPDLVQTEGRACEEQRDQGQCESSDINMKDNDLMSEQAKSEVVPDQPLLNPRSSDALISSGNSDSEPKELDSGIEISPISSEDDSNCSNKDQSKQTHTPQVVENLDKNPSANADKSVSLTPKSTQKRSTLTPKLSALHVDLKNTPKLSGGAGADFIDLGEDVSLKVKRPGIDKLMERLIQHSAKRAAKPKREMEVSTVTKEVTGNNQEELKLNKFTITLEAEEEPDELKKPGAKLVKLREKLQLGIKAKREAARQQRQELYELENEEGYEEEQNEEEDLEAELTDQTDTDAEGDEDEEEDMEENEDYLNDDEKDRERNPFVDEEAEDEDEDDDDMMVEEEDIHLHLDLDDDKENSDAQKTKPKKKKSELNKSKTMDLFADSDDSQPPLESVQNGRDTPTLEGELISTQPVEEDVTPQHKDSFRPSLFKDKDTSLSSADTSFEMMGSMIPAHQPGGGLKHTGNPVKPQITTPTLLSKIPSAISRSSSKLSDLTLPVEDSQDLYGPMHTQQENIQDSQNFHFSLDYDESQSQILDADGFLKLDPTQKKSSKRQLDLGQSQSQDNFDELLNLCSGGFGEGPQQSSQKVSKSRGIFSKLVAPTQDNMDELLGLCSGQFSGSQQAASQVTALKPSQNNSQSQNVGKVIEKDEDLDSPQKPQRVAKKRKAVIEDSDEEDGDMGTAPFEIVEETNLSNDGWEKEKQDDLGSDEEAEGGHVRDSEDEDDDEMPVKFSGFTYSNQHGKIRKEFVDEEAELSGSEYDSDENVDLDEKDDIMEHESGDEDALPDDEEIRNQVGRVQLKQAIDADKRELRLLQEMYLPDGDLYSEGGGRVRKFRWNNIDEDDTQQDMFGGQSDDENQNEEEGENETRWRMERYEREKWIEEQKLQEEGVREDESSQLIKLGRAVLRPKKVCAGSSVKPPTVKSSKSSEKHPTTPKSLSKIGHLRRGSFMGRNKEVLAQIAQTVKPVTNPQGPRNSRNFVFAAVSPEQEKEKPQPVRRSVSLGGSNGPNPKRLKLDQPSSFSQDSIFNLL
ncbi:claspin [Lingula anatina]|uniref:Claspin n=1 Tax=Lingula anatina TaxID=7574 RepID=A0A1S3IQ76_LINAN|nr:claspin [Lingula anatina]|eukprot:XP_013400066.1 claspin [Lingula anatina]